MASLVADYSDSDTDSESESCDDSPHSNVKEEIKEEVTDVKVKQETLEIKQEVPDIKPDVSDIKQEITNVKKELSDANEANIKSTGSFTNFLISNNTIDDDEDDEEEDENNSSVTTIKAKSSGSSSKLPNPMSCQKLPSINDASNLMAGASVFINTFEREEQAKNKILERHVRLTEAAPKKPANKPTCWKFKKGKCHMGKNCRFFHDRDALSFDESAVEAESSSASIPASNRRSMYHPAAYDEASRRRLDTEPVDDDNYMSNMKKKRRVGINDALIPPKKAYDSLLQLRQKERPWTMPHSPS